MLTEIEDELAFYFCKKMLWSGLSLDLTSLLKNPCHILLKKRMCRLQKNLEFETVIRYIIYTYQKSNSARIEPEGPLLPDWIVLNVDHLELLLVFYHLEKIVKC